MECAMSRLFRVADLRLVMQFLYPDIEDDRDDEENCEHPITAVGLVLLSGALIGTTKAGELVRVTGYSPRFISAIETNMQNNKLWIDGLYDCSNWFFPDGTIDRTKLWEHIDIACGWLWLPGCDTDVSADTCMAYSNGGH
jgi:hypothetical protein